jgi:hypothetical protein
MYLPTWAVSAFGVVFFAVAALAGWAIRLAGSQLRSDIGGVKVSVEKIDHKVDEIDKRLVRVETLLNGKHTPPVGVPTMPLPAPPNSGPSVAS